MPTKIQKTKLTFTVLHPATDDLADMSIEAIWNECDAGAFVGAHTEKVTIDVPDAAVAEELQALGNDGEFFNDILDDEESQSVELTVTLLVDGPVSMDVVSRNVAHAIEHMRQVEGLSAEDDDGIVLSVSVEEAISRTKDRDLANLLNRAAAVIASPESEIRSHREELVEDLLVEANKRAHEESSYVSLDTGPLIETDKTLDQAIDEFFADPSYNSAAILLTVATRYWNDGMIGDESYADQTRAVCDWLVDTAERSESLSIADAARKIASYTEGMARRNVYRVALAELDSQGRSLAGLLKELGSIIDLIDNLPIEDDGTRRLPSGTLDRARDIAAQAFALPN